MCPSRLTSWLLRLFEATFEPRAGKERFRDQSSEFWHNDREKPKIGQDVEGHSRLLPLSIAVARKHGSVKAKISAIQQDGRANDVR